MDSYTGPGQHISSGETIHVSAVVIFGLCQEVALLWFCHIDLTFMYLLHGQQVPVCTSCKELLSAQHFLTECSIYLEKCCIVHLCGTLQDILGDDQYSVQHVGVLEQYCVLKVDLLS
jgi:hypothetical protein